MRPFPPLKPTISLPFGSTTPAGPSALARPGTPGPAASALLALIRGYKLLLSPWFSGCCRYYPSCADYMAEAVTLHGAFRGVWLGLGRLARCHPFGGQGVDAVPR